MPTIDTTQLENLTNLTFQEFKDLDFQDQNRADIYYTALGLEGDNANLPDVKNYADLAGHVVNNDNINGVLANNFTEIIATNNGVDFSAGSDNRLRMQYELMKNDLQARLDNIVGGGSGELDFNDTILIHKDALDLIGLPPEAFSLYTPLTILAEHDPAKAQLLFQTALPGEGFVDVIQDGLFLGFGSNINGQQDLAGILNDYAAQADWLGTTLQSMQDLVATFPGDTSEITGRLETYEQLLNLAGGAFEQIGDWADAIKDALPSELFPDIPSWLPNLPLFDIPGVNFVPGGLITGSDPLVLDMDGNGLIDLVSVANSGVHFDFWGDGFAEATGWVGAGDGMLVHDLNGDGLIGDIFEMFGSPFPLGYLTDTEWDALQGEANGFAQLALHDGNADGKIDNADSVWTELQVWQDINQDGISQSGELMSVDVAGIESIDISGYVMDSFLGVLNGGWGRIIEGNTVTHSGSFTMTDGTTREAVDAWFDTVRMDTYYGGDYTLDVRALFLPTARGYGLMPDLHVAMSMDNGTGGLLDQVQGFMTGRSFEQLFSDFDAVRADVRGILMDWAGVDEAAAVDYRDHGLFAEMPEFFFLRQITALESDYTGTWFDEGGLLPWVSDGVQGIDESWDIVLDSYMARLVFQSGGEALFDGGVSYNALSDTFEGTAHLSQAAVALLQTEATGHANIEGFWHMVASFIDQVEGISNLDASEVTWLTDAVSASSGGAYSWTDITETLDRVVFDLTAGDDVINGSQWDDEIGDFWGTEGADTLFGFGGNDILSGGLDNDILDGGAGNDILRGGRGDDIYNYDSGHDVIIEVGGNYYLDTDIIQMDSGINVADVSLHMGRVDQASSLTEHFFLKIEGRGTITVQEDTANWSPLNALVDEVHFADGTILNIPEMDITLHGTAKGETISGGLVNGTHTIKGYEGNDFLSAPGNIGGHILDGGAGDDDILGSNGDDIFIFSAGNDRYYGGGGNNTILLPDGITEGDITFSREEILFGFNLPGYNDARLIIEGVGEGYIIDFFGNDPNWILQNLEFSDGTVTDLTSYNYEVFGTDGDDVIFDSDAQFIKDDTYHFGQGNDVIHDQYGGIDTLLFGEGVSFSDLTIQRFQGVSPTGMFANHLLIKDQSGNSVMFLRHFEPHGVPEINYSLEKLEFFDGTIVNLTDLEIEAHGTAGDDGITDGIIGDASTDDTIFGYAGNDTLDGGEGNDVIDGGEGNDVITGGDGNDTITGGDGNDIIHGGNGNDSIESGAGDDAFYGDAGDDTYIYTSGLDTVLNASGNDTLLFSPGISLENLTFSINNFYNLNITLNAGTDEVLIQGHLGIYPFGTMTFDDGFSIDLNRYNDWVQLADTGVSHTATALDDIIISGTGNDTLNGGSGIDQIHGGAGNDTLTGDDGDDHLNGGSGADIIHGSLGNDIVWGGLGTDILYGDAGTDTVSYKGTASGVVVDLSASTASDDGDGASDTLTGFENVTGSDHDDNITGDSGANVLAGLAGDDILAGRDGVDTLDGGTGNDTVNYSAALAGVVVSLTSGLTSDDGDGSTDTLVSIENVTGSTFNDLIFGDGNANNLAGNGGNDSLFGGAGDDIYTYTSGNVTIDETLSASTNDVLALTPGIAETDLTFMRFMSIEDDLVIGVDDAINGGSLGNITIKGQLADVDSQLETLRFLPNTDTVLTDVTVLTFGTNDGDFITGIATGASADDTIFALDGVLDWILGGIGDDTIYGGDGDDFIDGGIDSDDLYGGDGNDWILGNSEDDTLNGGTGNDTLNAGSGDDTLIGGTGSDTLESGTGVDSLWGGFGADTFIFLTNTAFSGLDTINDFSTAQGDIIDIANVLTGFYDPLTEAIADFVQITDNGADSTLSIDQDGTGTASNFVDVASITGGAVLDVDNLVTNGNLIV